MKKINYRKISIGVFVFFMILSLCTGCTKNKDIEIVKDDNKKDTINIGLSFDSFVIERWITDRDVFVSTANELGAQVNVQCAYGNAQEQIKQIEYLIDKKVDVIVVISADKKALAPVMRRAKETGIKTICYDRLVENSNCDLFITFDSEKVGEFMGQVIAEKLNPEDEIFMINGPETDDNVAQIRKGFMQAIKEKNLKIVYDKYCENWDSQIAYKYCNEAINMHPEVKAIMCGNDDLATQVFISLSEHQKAGKVLLTGQDGDLIACQRIVEGTQNMTAYKSIENIAKTAARCAVMLANGSKLTYVNGTINDGTYNVPYIMLEPKLVTKDTIDQVIIDSGFHAREDVYRNVTK